MKDRIKIISAMFLLVISIVMYLVIHGTDDLVIVQKINSVINIVSVFPGINCKNVFLTGYLVDILWFCSFLLFGYALYTGTSYIVYMLFAFLVALSVEIIQLFFPRFGTFDFWDIVVYELITFVYFLVAIVENKFHVGQTKL